VKPQIETYKKAVRMPETAARAVLTFVSVYRSQIADTIQRSTKTAERAMSITNTSSVLNIVPSIRTPRGELSCIMPRRGCEFLGLFSPSLCKPVPRLRRDHAEVDSGLSDMTSVIFREVTVENILGRASTYKNTFRKPSASRETEPNDSTRKGAQDASHS
jgi:hypothetical protein